MTTSPDPTPNPGSVSADLAAAIAALRELILAGEHYRLAASTYLGLTISESQAVSYLLSRGPLGQHELAPLMNMTSGSITALVDRLERRGFVERTPHPTDRRRVTVSISDHGTRALEETLHWMLDAFTDIAQEQLVDLTSNLRTIASGLIASTDRAPAQPAGGTTVRRRR